ncbi:peroxiredoxin family protein [Demequina gelatinilytica]|uniref:peroxiredoxin family protein n=1 Tax=Demequina gelatinilytica TaxID=1638980 RepID=UPI00078431D8|nr:redoxin domain-containing protein [Demequina gelatinilytica]
MIATGSRLELDLVDTKGEHFDLARYSGSEAVFVYFMRAILCMQCNAHARTLAAHAGDFRERGVEVVIVIPDTIDAAANWKAKKSIPFPVVVSDGADAHASVGLMRKVFGAVQQSGGILIDRAGIVRYTHSATNPGGSYDAAALDEAIAALG